MTKNKSKNFRLEEFQRGAPYNSSSDYRRFVTLDYNMESYFGIVGVGILSGWEIQSNNSLTISITPGKGVIDGYAVESPYIYKLRSEIVSGDREIEEVHDMINQTTRDPILYPNLTEDQKEDYVAIIQEYDPSFNPSGDIEDCPVKIVIPYTINLPDNSQRYIIAERKSGATSYPIASDYPIVTAIRPNERDYTNNSAYKADLAAYDAQIQTIRDYEWRNNPINHYDVVEFSATSSYSNSKSKILLGRVITKDGSVFKIDLSQVSNLSNMESVIKSASKYYLSRHTHGGSKFYDPPKIKLQTDIRQAILQSVTSPKSGTSSFKFDVLNSQMTSVQLGHQHTYHIDSSGNGYTVGKEGSTDIHFHKIENSVVGEPEASETAVQSHTHTLPEVSEIGMWNSESSFVVYVNDVLVGDQSSTSISADPTNQTLTLYDYIGVSYKSYYSSFDVTINNEIISYTFSSKAACVSQFMFQMELDFSKKYGDKFLTTEGISSLHPFIFTNEDGSIVGFDDLLSQSVIAESMLKNIGDTFLFTPNAARNIPITLQTTESKTYNVKIEILGNTEVSGKLSADNILYVSAEKLQTGELEIARIPFVSHIGRMNEDALPIKYSMISGDGVVYNIVPAITDNNLDHYHRLYLNASETGKTIQTLIGEEPVYYAEGLTGTTYLIDHIHSVLSSNVSSVSTDGLTNWQNDINASNVSSSYHTHAIIDPVIGNPKVVYSVREGADGTIFAGTSSSLIAIPSGDAYLFIVNGVQVYLIGSDLWDLLLEAKMYYESNTGKILTVTTELYGDQIDDIVYNSLLENNGDSVLLKGAVDPFNGQDEVMIKRFYYFEVPNYTTLVEKQESEVKKDDVIVGKKIIDELTGDEITEEEMKALLELDPTTPITTLYIVKKPLDKIPAWSMEIKKETNGDETIICVGSTSFAANTDIESDFYKYWSTPSIPSFVGSMKKVLKDSSNNMWVATNGGLIVSREHNDNKVFETTTQPDFNPEINDVIEGERGAIYVACNGGIYKSIDDGFTWTNILSSLDGFSNIVRDFALDITDSIQGHTHTFDVNVIGDGLLNISVGSGIPHMHNVSEWSIDSSLGHLHTMVTTLYAISNNGKIYKSVDNGTLWTLHGSIPSGENSTIFAHDGLFIGKEDGLYKFNGNAWEKISDEIIYSYGLKYDLSGMLLGCYNKIIETDDFTTFTTLQEMDGNPLPVFYEEGEQSFFGYAYSSKGDSFHFKDIAYGKSNSFSLIDFGRWVSSTGVWDETAKYDIYIDKVLVLSTKKNIDRRESLGYSFEVIPSEGAIDFRASSDVTGEIGIFDDSVTVASSQGFVIGDAILIKSIKSVTSEVSLEENSGIDVHNEIPLIESMQYYAKISNIVDNQIYITENIDKVIDLPAMVYRIPNVDGSTEIKINIYESPLSNSGSLTHEEIEDSISYKTDGLPYLFNNTYLTNLLQLTQAARYVYPTIDSKFQNSKFYDFRYSWNPLDSNYIGNEVDLYNCEVYNFSIFNNKFTTKGAKKINKVIIGSGAFYGNIIISTDIGIFWAKIEDGLEGNWFYVPYLEKAVYDIKIFGSSLFACTVDGTYKTQDMVTWELQDSSAIDFPSTAMAFRWTGRETVSISNHTTTFTNGYLGDSNVGSIVAVSSLYGDLINNRKIDIIGASNASGIYTIKQIANDNTIVTYELFPEDGPETDTNVRINMGAWWEYLNGSQSEQNPVIENTLIVGGENRIAICNNASSYIWSESFIPDEITGFSVTNICPINNGTVMASTASSSILNTSNYLFSSNDTGDSWSVFKEFKTKTGTILQSTLTDFGHTKLKVSYSGSLKYRDGDYNKQTISIFTIDSTVAIYTGDILWNEQNDGDYIYTYGKAARDALYGIATEVSFSISPIKINGITELSDKTILYATDNGIYSDQKSLLNPSKYSGVITDVAFNGIVSRVDTNGRIKSIYQNIETKNVVFSISMDENISGESLVGQMLYITDLPTVVGYKILSNSGNIEIAVEVEQPYSSEFTNYIQKRVTVAPKDHSRIYVSLDASVYTNQFINGKMYSVANASSNITSGSYDIKYNTDTYFDVTPAIVPVSTTFTQTGTSNIITGQSVKVMDSTMRVDLFVNYDNGMDIDDNQLSGMTISISDDQNSEASNLEMTIYSNDRNKITVNPIASSMPPMAFKNGDVFYAYGFVFNNLANFNDKKTSIEIDHYHDVNLIGNVVSGSILSFSNVNSSFVDINVSDIDGFDNPLIQASNDLLSGVKIYFYNPLEKKYWYISEVVDYTAYSIKVKIKSSEIWDFVSNNEVKISNGWNWQIDASNYGYTINTYYNNFTKSYTRATQDIGIGDTTIYVESTADFSIGSKVRIRDENMKYEINYVLLIPDSTTLVLRSPTVQYYEKMDSPFIEVLTNTFTNNHAHQIRNNQVQTLYISDYLNRGYISFHSHKTLAHIPVVSKIIERNGEIVAVGSSEKIFISYNSGGSWKELTDLNNVLENGESISGISDICLDGNNKFVVATDNGYVATENLSTSIVPLEKPAVI